VYRPTKLRETFEFFDGCSLLWSDEELEALAAMGDAIAVGPSRYRCSIPQHHAYSAADALAIMDGYRRIAERLGWPCLFRGQSRDYYSAEGRLLVLPTIMRPRLRRLYGRLYSSREPLVPWLKVLEDLDIPTGSGISADIRGRDGERIGVFHVSAPFAVMRGNPAVAGILQHYGFPTNHLDVTTDHVVSLWFALHASSTNRRRIAFTPVLPPRAVKRRTPPRPDDVAEIPTLHVYIAPPLSGEDTSQRFAVVYLSRLEMLTAVASRPSRQSAVSLPFEGHSLVQFPRAPYPLRRSETAYRWPAAIIKLYFPFEDVGRPDLTAHHLFPTDEPLYRRLLEAKAPHLAVYAEPDRRPASRTARPRGTS
jgi:hypothetical protein